MQSLYMLHIRLIVNIKKFNDTKHNDSDIRRSSISHMSNTQYVNIILRISTVQISGEIY